MKIKIWGCRGTIPSPGEHTLKYGGNTTCVEIRDEGGFRTVIDAGSGLRLLGKQIIKDKCKEICLMITHAHWDHLMGFPFFTPAYIDGFKINLCGVAAAKDYLSKILPRQLEAPYFPVDFSQLKAEFHFCVNTPGKKLCHRLKIDSIELSHPNGGYGYKFVEDGKTFVFLTDNELSDKHSQSKTYQQYVDFCKNSDLLLHDAQYTNEEYKKTKGWGHSTYDMAVSLAKDANVKSLGLIHHDPDRTDEQLDKIVNELKLKLQNDKSKLNLFAAYEQMEIQL